MTNGSPRANRQVKNILGLLLLLVLAGTILYFVSPVVMARLAGVNVLGNLKSFDTVSWKASQTNRAGMICDLIWWRKLNGLTQEEVEKILGKPDDSNLELFPNSYIVSGSSGNCSYLRLEYGSDKRVNNVFILKHSSF